MQTAIARAVVNPALDGHGVVVGVISDSYNVLGGASADVQSGDLPADVRVLHETARRPPI